MAGFFEYIISFVNNMGYFGIFIATALEYACFPISSEILLPFIGYSVYIGQLSLPLAILASTAGGAIGCSFCYSVGRFGRKIIEDVILRKFSSVKEGIKKSDSFFNRIGKQSVFIGRLMPIVRTYISFPAGMTKMRFSIFFLYSVCGSLLWNTVLVSIGYLLGEHWEKTSNFFSHNKVVILFIFTCIIAFLVYKKANNSITEN